MKQIFITITLGFFLSSCATHTEKVLDATWASMKHSNPPTSKDKLTKVGNVNEEYCLDTWSSGSFGLMDEAVKKAESRFNIDYIKYPAFTQTIGKSCVQVSGEGYRIAN